jgi:hypothetical protein
MEFRIGISSAVVGASSTSRYALLSVYVSVLSTIETANEPASVKGRRASHVPSVELMRVNGDVALSRKSVGVLNWQLNSPVYLLRKSKYP